MYGEGRTTPDQSQWLVRVHSPQCLEHRITIHRVHVAGTALAKAAAGRTPFDVFDVDLALFDYCFVPDVGRQPVRELRPDVGSFFYLGPLG